MVTLDVSEAPGRTIGKARFPQGIHLLCIGISAYSRLSSLTTAAASALLVTRRFEQLSASAELPLPLESARLIVAPSDVEVELVGRLAPEEVPRFDAARSECTRSQLVDTLNEWFEVVRRNPDDIALLYFAGHGIGADETPGEASKTLLLASDFEQDFSRAPRAISIEHVISALQPVSPEDSVARAQLYLLDCCRERAWEGPAAEQGDLSIPVADRRRMVRHARDDRRVAVHYACCAGDQTWSSDNSPGLEELRVTNYCQGLLAALDRLGALPVLQVEQLLQHIERFLQAKHDQQTRRGRADNFALRLLPAGFADSSRRARVAAAGPRADSRAPTEFESAPALAPTLAQSPMGGALAAREVSAAAPGAEVGGSTSKASPGWLWLAMGVPLVVLGGVVASQYLAAPEDDAPPVASAGQPSVDVVPAGVTLVPANDGEDPDMIRFVNASFVSGSSSSEARAAYAGCLAYGEAHGWVGAELPAAMPCKRPFEASPFIRETWTHQTRSLAPFLLDSHEVTVSEFATWLNSIKTQLTFVEQPTRGLPLVVNARGVALGAIAKTQESAGSGKVRFTGQEFAAGTTERRPVTNVTWLGAVEFCRSHAKRLPTEFEWEFAARGGRGRQYPWGDSAPSDCAAAVYGRQAAQECASLGGQLPPVGSAAADRTADGVWDLGGSVSEWTADRFVDPRGNDSTCLDSDAPCRVVRGGGFVDHAVMMRSALRGRVRQDAAFDNIGFRCAKDGS